MRFRVRDLWRRKQPSLRHLETFCVFVGYPRTGHNLMGALLSAHPDAAVAIEFKALAYLRKRERSSRTRGSLLRRLLRHDRRFVERGCEFTGYSYAVPGQWQGRNRSLKVMGDTGAGWALMALEKDPTLLAQLRDVVGVPLRLVHMVRNPYDTITTHHLRWPRPLDDAIDYYFGLCRLVAPVLDSWSVLTAFHEDFIVDPPGRFAEIVSHVGLVPEDGYVRDCCSIVHSEPHQSRHRIEWDPERIERVDKHMRGFHWLARYSFDDATATRAPRSES